MFNTEVLSIHKLSKRGDLVKKILYTVMLLMLFYTPSFAKNNLNAYINNISLSDFIKFVSQRTNQNFSFEPSLIPKNIKVTIYSPLALSNSDLMKILHSVLKENGFLSVKKGKSLAIIRIESLRNVGVQYESKLKTASNSVVTTMIRLKNVEASKLRLPLTHLVSSFGHVDTLNGFNTDFRRRIIVINLSKLRCPDNFNSGII